MAWLFPFGSTRVKLTNRWLLSFELFCIILVLGTGHSLKINLQISCTNSQFPLLDTGPRSTPVFGNKIYRDPLGYSTLPPSKPSIPMCMTVNCCSSLVPIPSQFSIVFVLLSYSTPRRYGSQCIHTGTIFSWPRVNHRYLGKVSWRDDHRWIWTINDQGWS